MTAEPVPDVHITVILPHVNGRQVLMLPDAGGWALPHWTATEPQFWQVVNSVNRWMHDHLGVETTVLRCVHYRWDSETRSRFRVYALENHTPSWTPPAGARWVEEEELADLDLAPREQLSLLQAWLAGALAHDRPAKRVPWACPGWFEQTTAWMCLQAERAGLAITGPFEQLRTWQRSCLVRAATTGGTIYLKAVPPMFALEPRLTQVLAEWYPTHSPHVLAVDPDRHWLLTRDLEGKSLEAFPEIEHWEEAVRAYARLQIDCAARLDELIALGCADRRLEPLTAWIDPLLEDTTMLLPENKDGLSRQEIGELRALAPRLKAMCGELASYRVPPTLEHGDFYYAQVIVRDGRYSFIDWSDSSVAHPFFSIFLFIAYGEEVERFPTIPDAWTRLRDAYLEPWTIFEPMERLVTAFELSQALAPVHGAVFYQRFILPHLEFKEEWEAMAPWLLKRLLHGLKKDQK